MKHLLSDPMFYLCMAVCVTVIYAAALAASGRDGQPGEDFEDLA